MEYKEPCSWVILNDPPTCESKPIQIKIPEELAGATAPIIFSLQRSEMLSFINPSLLSKRVPVEILSSEGGPKIKEIYWCDSKGIEYGVSSKPRTDPLMRNETVYLHIHTRGLYGKQVVCSCNAIGQRVLGVRNNVIVETYTFFDDKVNEIIMKCCQAPNNMLEIPKVEQSVTIPYIKDEEIRISRNVMQVYAYPEKGKKKHYASESCCRVDFRPTDKYNGLFGFSWYRTGDMSFLSEKLGIYSINEYKRTKENITSYICNDHAFSRKDCINREGIMGYHWETKAENGKKVEQIVENGNKSGTGCDDIIFENINNNALARDNFIPDESMAEEHKNDYIKIYIDGYKEKLEQSRKEYLTPVMTLKEGMDAELQLFLYVKKPPKRILFAFDNPRVEEEKFITMSVLNSDIIDPSEALYTPNLEYKIKLKCNKSFNREVRLKAYAIPVMENYDMAYKKEDGRIYIRVMDNYPLVLPELCGMLRILPNDVNHWLNDVKVVFFNVITMVNGKDKISGLTENDKKEEEEDTVNKYLAQAYVKIKVEYCNITLTGALSFPDTLFPEKREMATLNMQTYKSCCAEGYLEGKKVYYIDKSKDGLLSALLEGVIPDKYRGSEYYKIFFLPEVGKGRNGFYSPDFKFVVSFSNRRDETTVHEILHAMGLPHTFGGNKDEGATYTYEDGKTDNIMDYSHQIGVNRKSLFEWQWKAINTGLNK